MIGHWHGHGPVMEKTTEVPVLLTGAADVREQVLAAAAAAAVQVRVCGEPDELGPVPPPVLLVGADRAAVLARSPVVSRTTVHLVGAVADQQRLCEWSAALGATVIVLPDGLRWLTTILAGGRGGRATGRMIAVVGGSGGVGASTLAVGVAWAAVRQGRRVALVDLDAGGGGLDLLLGLEQAPGWRWPALLGADGFLGDLHGQLPRLESLAVLSHAREQGPELGPAAVTAVLRSLRRTHDLVVIDAGARPAATEPAAVRGCDGALLVCSGDLRGVAAAAQRIRGIDAQVPLAAVLSRVRSGSHGEDAIGRALGVPVITTLPADKRVAVGAEAGEPPGRSAGRAWRRTCHRVLAGLQLEDADDRG
jgi:secretion/DNA translocation related CpaE-like protein